MNPGRILVRLGMLWVFLVIGGAVLSYLFTSPSGLPGLAVVFASNTCTVTGGSGTPVGPTASQLAAFGLSYLPSGATFEVVENEAVIAVGRGTSQGTALNGEPQITGWSGSDYIFAYPSNGSRVVFEGSSAPTNSVCNGTLLTATSTAAGITAMSPTSFSSTSYSGITQAVFGFVPLVVALAFIVPVLGAIGMGGYSVYNKLRTSREA